MTPEQFRLLCIAAQSLLAYRDSGRKCDPDAVRWAETVLRVNAKHVTALSRAPAFGTHESDSEGGEL